MANLITKETVKELGLVQETKATEIKKEFDTITVGLVELEKEVNKIIENSEKGIDKKLANEAKSLRNKIVKVRTSSDKKRKELTNEARLFVNAVNGTYKVIEYAVKSKEETLKKIETAYEEAEQIKLDKIRNERIEILKKYDVEVYPNTLEKMSESIFNSYVDGCKSAYELKKEEERIELERIEKEKAKAELEKTRRYQTSRLINFIDDYDSIVFAEMSECEFDLVCEIAVDKRTEQEMEQAQIKAENEKLKAEAEERTRLAIIEEDKRIEQDKAKQDKADKEKKELQLKLEKQEKEKAKLQADLKAKEDKEKLELEKKLNAEREEKEKAQKELSEKKESERLEKERVENEKKLAEEKLKNANDTEKINKLISDLQSLVIPEVESEINKTKISQCVELLNGAKEKLM